MQGIQPLKNQILTLCRFPDFHILKKNVTLEVTTKVMLKQAFILKWTLFGVFCMILCVGYSFAPAFPAFPQEKAQNDGDEDEDEPGINSGGEISSDENICDSGVPGGIKNVTAPTGDFEGFLLIRWEKKSIGGSWEVIPSETVLDYFPAEEITSTTQYRRGCRESVHQPWIYSNIITKRIVAGIDEVTLSSTSVTCNDGNDGTATAFVTGGTPPYSYEWTNGDNEASITNVTAGFYAVSVTDFNGCNFTTESQQVMEPPVSVTINAVLALEPSCPGMENGMIFVEAMDGVPPYTYSWSNGNEGPANLDIAAGFYDVMVTDQLGCKNQIEGILLNEPLAFNANNNTEPTTCFAASDGEAMIEPHGGTAPYNFYWPDGSTNVVRTDLAAGTYDLQIVDFNGCVYIEKIIIEQPEALSANVFTVNNKLCKATVNVAPFGGTSPYTFEWEDGSTNGFVADLCPGVYAVEITDFNGCKSKELIEVSSDYAIDDIEIEIIVNPLFEEGNIAIKLPFNKEADISVYTANGQLVEEFQSEFPQELDQRINLALDLNKYSNGSYVIRVNSGGLTTSEKIVISK